MKREAKILQRIERGTTRFIERDKLTVKYAFVRNLLKCLGD